MSSQQLSPRSLSPLRSLGLTPNFIHPAHGGDNYCPPDASDLCRASILPPLPDAHDARQAESWSAWENWQLAVALLPERDTVNGEFFDLRDIAPAVGTCKVKNLSTHVQTLYPNWEGRYKFMLKHILCVIKRYLRDGSKAHTRADLIRLNFEKHFPASN